MEVLLVRFDKGQRAFIRKVAKRLKESEASIVRRAVRKMAIDLAPKKKEV